MNTNTEHPLITATICHGERVNLTKFWQDKNVICPNSKLFYVTDGEIAIEIDKTTVIGGAGDMVLIPACVKHDFHLTSLNRASKYWIHFDMKVGKENVFDCFSLPFKVHIGNNDYVESLFQTALKLIDSDKLSDRLNVSSALCSLIAFYADRCGFYANRNTEDEIERAINFIKNRYTEKFSLNDLCKTANLSKGYFIKKFKERTGYSPAQYANLLRIDKAKTMIEQSNLPINKIMEQLGFYDSAHFSKLFKSRCGYSPKKFRELNYYRAGNVKR